MLGLERLKKKQWYIESAEWNINPIILATSLLANAFLFLFFVTEEWRVSC